MSSHTNDLHDRIRARTGTAVLATASVFAVMIFCDRMDMTLVSLPPLWYSSRSSHLVLCVIMFVVAAVLEVPTVASGKVTSAAISHLPTADA